MTQAQKIAEFMENHAITDFEKLEDFPAFIQAPLKEALLVLGQEFARQASVYTESLRTQTELYLSAAQCVGMADNNIPFNDPELTTEPVQDILHDIDNFLCTIE